MEPDFPLTDEQRKVVDEEMAKSLEREGLKAGTVEAWEDGYRTADQPDAFEWWYFDSQFDQGWTAVVTFNTKPSTKPKSDLKPSVLMILGDPEGNKRHMTAAAEPSTFEASKETCEVRVGPSHVKGDLKTYDLHAEVEDVTVDLKFTRGAPSWRPGAGITYMNSKKTRYFAWVAAVPYGTVEGTITVAGEGHEVTGTGYHDHNWGNIAPGLGIDHWYWGRAHAGEFSLIFTEIVTVKVPGAGHLKLPVFFLAKGEEMVTDDGFPLSLVAQDFVEGPREHPYPKKLDLHWHTPEGDIVVSIREPSLIESLDVIDDMPRWQQAIIHLVANPTYYDFNADVTFDIDYKGIKERVEGKGLFEMMMFK